MQTQLLFILGDGDNIRERIESLLFSKNFTELHKVSESFSVTIRGIKKLVVSGMNGEVLMAGGDDLLFRINKKNYKREIIEKLAEYFKKNTGNSMSFGVGSTIEDAYLNLRKAKSLGKGIVVDGVANYE